jgi:hypothetical protein
VRSLKYTQEEVMRRRFGFEQSSWAGSLNIEELSIMETTMSVVAAIFNPFGSHRVILPCNSCNAITWRGVVQIEHPHGSFSMPYDRFSEHVQQGSIHVQQT